MLVLEMTLNTNLNTEKLPYEGISKNVSRCAVAFSKTSLIMLGAE